MPILYFILNNVCLPKQNRNITQKCILKGTALKYNLTCKFLKTGVNIKGFSLWNNNSHPSWGEYLAWGSLLSEAFQSKWQSKMTADVQYRASSMCSPKPLEISVTCNSVCKDPSRMRTAAGVHCEHLKNSVLFTTVNTTTFTSLSRQMAPVHKYTL